MAIFEITLSPLLDYKTQEYKDFKYFLFYIIFM